MKVTIEIKESNINAANLYQIASYTESGIYLNTDEHGLICYVMSIKADGLVYFMGNKSQCETIFEANIKPEIIEPKLMECNEPLEEIDQVVSESFALVLNKEKFNDVN